MLLRVTSLSVTPVELDDSPIISVDGNPPFSRVIEVNRRRPTHAAVKAAAPEHPIDMLMANTVPLLNTSVVKMMFFQLEADRHDSSGFLTDLGQVMDAYARLDLEPDPIAQAAINEDDKEFAHEFPNMSVWNIPYRTKIDRAYMRFDRPAGSHNRVSLELDRGKVVSDQSCWYGGVPKSPRPFVLPSRGSC